MKSTLREVGPRLWVSDAESADSAAPLMGIIIDCTGRAPSASNKIHARPTGVTGHSWTVEDLDRVVDWASAYLDEGKRVLIHCNRGRSRSTCAAAAVLLARGIVDTVPAALARTSMPGDPPVATSAVGLRKWWEAKQEARQERMFG